MLQLGYSDDLPSGKLLHLFVPVSSRPSLRASTLPFFPRMKDESDVPCLACEAFMEHHHWIVDASAEERKADVWRRMRVSVQTVCQFNI